MHVRDPAVCTFCRVVSAGSLYPVSCSVRGMDFDRIFFILFIGLFTFFVTFDDFRSHLQWAYIRFG